MQVLEFGYQLLCVAAAVVAATAVFAAIGLDPRRRRFVLAARTGFLVAFVLLLGVAGTLMHGFVAGAYNNEYIFFHSERSLNTFFKLAGLWAGLEGSLIFWTVVLAGLCSVAALQHRWSARHGPGRRLEPWTYLVLSGVLGFFVWLCIRENAFESMSTEHAVAFSQRYGIPIDETGCLTDGKGLHPQLNNYWFVIHPPMLYLGLITFTIPFAFGLAALVSGELGDYWVRIARRWTLVGWMFLTCGIILGGLWAYRQLGWGGYWAWDPVENASFLPWCTATAFLHSIMIQERRDMLKGWNVFLILFTFYLTIEATYMTRSGEVASVHTFALNEGLGDVFRWFKLGIGGLGLFLLAYRWRGLRGSHRLESIFSREGAFFVNNLVLVAMALAVWFLSWLPTNSHYYLGQSATVDASYYNRVMTPLFGLLLLLTAVGPGLGWVKTPFRTLRRNFLGPLLAATAFTGVVYLVLALQGSVDGWRQVLVPKAIDDALRGFRESDALFYSEGLYPTGIILFLAALIVSVVVSELLRAVRGRRDVRGEDLLGAFLSVVTRDNRRYGGYIVHVGIAVIATGVIASSMFRQNEVFNVRLGETVRVGEYLLTPLRATRDAGEFTADATAVTSGTPVEEVQPGLSYFLDELTVRVTRPGEGMLPKAHGAATSESGVDLSETAARSPVVTELRPELRYYPKQETWIPEVSIDRGLIRDIYVVYHERTDEKIHMEVFINPFVSFIWIGWFVLIAGGLYALLPMGRRRVGLVE